MNDKKKKRNDLKAQLEKLGYSQDARGYWEKNGSKDEIRRAVRRRKPVSVAPAVTVPEKQIHYKRDIPRQNPVRSAASVRPYEKKVVLEEAVKGTEICAPCGSTSFLVTRKVGEIEQAESVSSLFKDHVCAGDSNLCSRLAKVCDPSEITQEDVIFMDVESTGLGNSPIFLIGIMVWNEDDFEVRQFFARNYAEERSIVSQFIEECSRRKLLVTFNGKSFDFPYIRARSAVNGLKFSLEPHHLDMLHECRRIWRRRLPDCKLQTLEAHVCGRLRQGDIPGSQIPDAYHEYVRSSDAWQMVDVLKHNMLDLVTMADLMNRFPPVKERGQRPSAS